MGSDIPKYFFFKSLEIGEIPEHYMCPGNQATTGLVTLTASTGDVFAVTLVELPDLETLDEYKNSADNYEYIKEKVKAEHEEDEPKNCNDEPEALPSSSSPATTASNPAEIHARRCRTNIDRFKECIETADGIVLFHNDDYTRLVSVIKFIIDLSKQTNTIVLKGIEIPRKGPFGEQISQRTDFGSYTIDDIPVHEINYKNMNHILWIMALMINHILGDNSVTSLSFSHIEIRSKDDDIRSKDDEKQSVISQGDLILVGSAKANQPKYKPNWSEFKFNNSKEKTEQLVNMVHQISENERKKIQKDIDGTHEDLFLESKEKAEESEKEEKREAKPLYKHQILMKEILGGSSGV